MTCSRCGDPMQVVETIRAGHVLRQRLLCLGGHSRYEPPYAPTPDHCLLHGILKPCGQCAETWQSEKRPAILKTCERCRKAYFSFGARNRFCGPCAMQITTRKRERAGTGSSRTCQHCGTPFMARGARSKFCSPLCSYKGRKHRMRRYATNWRLTLREGLR